MEHRGLEWLHQPWLNFEHSLPHILQSFLRSHGWKPERTCTACASLACTEHVQTFLRVIIYTMQRNSHLAAFLRVIIATQYREQRLPMYTAVAL